MTLHFDDNYRILDPTQNAYWFCTYLLDYLARQVNIQKLET